MNRDCELSPGLLEAYLDGSLKGRDRRRVQRHLVDCPACRTAEELERQIRHDFAALPELPCPNSVTDRVLAVTVEVSSHDGDLEVHERPVAVRALRTRSLPLRVAGGSVGLAAAVLLAFLLGRDRIGGDPTPLPAEPGAVAIVATVPEDVSESETRQGFAITARLIERAETTVSATITETLPSILHESLARALQRPSGGRG